MYLVSGKFSLPEAQFSLSFCSFSILVDNGYISHTVKKIGKTWSNLQYSILFCSFHLDHAASLPYFLEKVFIKFVETFMLLTLFP